MCNLSGTFALSGTVYAATGKQPQWLAHKQRSRLNIALFALFAICFYSLSASAQYGGGSGTADEPYLIYTAEQMNSVGANPDNWDKHFKLMADIDLTGSKAKSFNIIGSSFAPFRGVFSGNSKKLLNFTYGCTDRNYIGLFGFVSGKNAEIKDLDLVDARVDAGTGDYVGLLVGWLGSGSITNCYVQGGSVLGHWCVGRLAGSNDGTITNCYSIGDVSADYSVGGLVGRNSETITYCSAGGSVFGKNRRVGGLVGENWGTISECSSSGIVSGLENVGGLVGYNSGTIVNCYSSADVLGGSSVGGLVGVNGRPFTGCVCGYGTICNCYSTGSTTGTMNVGGLVGTNQFGPITCSFWNSETSDSSKMCGSQDTHGTGCDNANGKMTGQMKMADTFTSAGWDFVAESVNGAQDVWCICEGAGYPQLAWQFVMGDFDDDGKVNLADFVIFATRWLQTDGSFWCGGADLTDDGDVDSEDLKELAENWLAGRETTR